MPHPKEGHRRKYQKITYSYSIVVLCFSNIQLLILYYISSLYLSSLSVLFSFIELFAVKMRSVLKLPFIQYFRAFESFFIIPLYILKIHITSKAKALGTNHLLQVLFFYMPRNMNPLRMFLTIFKNLCNIR